MKLVLCPAYLPNVVNFSWMIKQPKVYFYGELSYQKQSFRNRAEIYGANGKLKLTIPIKHSKGVIRKSYKNVSIDYGKNWQKIHWKSICSAYRSSPYFEYYESELYPFFQKKQVALFHFNIILIEKLMLLIEHSFDYQIVNCGPNELDILDSLISAKRVFKTEFKTYVQVFRNKYGFIPNLSVLDVLFNLGPDTKRYLNNIKLNLN